MLKRNWRRPLSQFWRPSLRFLRHKLSRLISILKQTNPSAGTKRTYWLQGLMSCLKGINTWNINSLINPTLMQTDGVHPHSREISSTIALQAWTSTNTTPSIISKESKKSTWIIYSNPWTKSKRYMTTRNLISLNNFLSRLISFLYPHHFEGKNSLRSKLSSEK